MNVSFSGHRDRIANWWQLKSVIDFYNRDGNLTVIHGGAIGFDTQVDKVSRRLGLTPKIYKPDWNRYGKSAAHWRNKIIVDQSETLVVLYDWRLYGGTYGTIQYAMEKDKSIIYLDVMKTWNDAKKKMKMR